MECGAAGKSIRSDQNDRDAPGRAPRRCVRCPGARIGGVWRKCSKHNDSAKVRSRARGPRRRRHAVCNVDASCMNGHPQSSQPGYPGHMLAPMMPVRDHDDVRMRVRNFRASMNACPTCWRVYFETHAHEMEREIN